jgi:hypothetical protein
VVTFGSTAVPRAGGTIHGVPASSVCLYWIPLGAGGHSVRANGVAYEALMAAVERRARCDLYHSALEIVVPCGRHMVEMTPVPDGRGHRRGVVAEGPVGLRAAGRVRLFRYEVRRWRDGVIPDLAHAVGGRTVVTTDPACARAVFDLLPSVPTPTWGRDEAGAGEMWSCNSVISWVLTRAGVDVDAIAMPPRARAPGWVAGSVVARRTPSGPEHRRGSPHRVGDPGQAVDDENLHDEEDDGEHQHGQLLRFAQDATR